ERREFLEFQTSLHLDGIASRNGKEFREASIRPKPWPADVGTNLRVADEAMAARAITPSGRDDHMVAFLEPRRFRHGPADLAYHARDFMSRRDGRLDISIALKKLVDEEHVATAHPAGLDVDENFIRLNIGNRHVLEDKGFVIFVNACCFHIYLLGVFLVNVV